ncbi:MAG: DUF2946 family protein [Alphaproteobacteria bacterium]|nr:DUF2946 family protein [Alphaproteobacteria bacterium]
MAGGRDRLVTDKEKTARLCNGGLRRWMPYGVLRRWMTAAIVLVMALNVFLPFLATGEAFAAPSSAAKAGLYEGAAICHHASPSDAKHSKDHHGFGTLCPLCQLLGHHGAYAPVNTALVTGPVLTAAQFPILPPSDRIDCRPAASPRSPRAPPVL